MDGNVDLICLLSDKSKTISNDQELIQSDPTSCPQNQKGNNYIHKLTVVYERHSNEQLFPRQVIIELPKIY